LNKVIANSYNCESRDIHVAQLLSDAKLKKIKSEYNIHMAQLLSDAKHRKIESEYNRLENRSRNVYWRTNAIEAKLLKTTTIVSQVIYTWLNYCQIQKREKLKMNTTG